MKPLGKEQTLTMWSTEALTTSPIIRQLNPVSHCFYSFKSWPTINEYQAIFKQFTLPIKPVEQSTFISSYEEEYEPRIFFKRELQTRTKNWHDFFNALVWLSFPNTKKTLNELHVSQSLNRISKGKRSLLENRITQFDECGAIIISNNEMLLDLIRQHQWEKLFVDHHEQFKDNIQCIVFGHAIFEKSLKPYIGMTCHSILLNDNTLLNAVKNNQTQTLDYFMAKQWKNIISSSPDKFHPFPILGIPGYWPNQDKVFYSNTDYFRKKNCNYSACLK